MRKFYSFLGLCKRSGNIAAGETAAEHAVRKKTARLLILAEDASANTKKKFYNSAAYYGIALLETGNKEELGKAIGTEQRAILAVTEEGFAKKLKTLAEDQIEDIGLRD